MRKNLIKTAIGTILIVTLFFSMLDNVAADGMIIPEQIYSYSYGVSSQIKIINYPEIKYHIVNVSINNQYVLTHVDQEFYNPYDETLVGTYIFPVPEGAVLSNFTVIINGEEKTAKIMDADEAKEFFQQSVTEMNDASLLQYLDNNLFSCKVTIPPKSSIKMSLSYEEILTMNGGMYKYVYTLSTEQYSSSNIDIVSVNVNLNSDKNIDLIYSPSHDISTEQISLKEVLVTYEVNNARPDTDFELYYSVTDQDFGASLLTFTEDNEDFFMLFFNSNNEQTDPEDYISKDIIFVIDDSGSMEWDDKINQAKDALKWILQKLRDDDRFNIVNFDYNASTFSLGLEDVSSETILEAIDYVDALVADGGTNINDALLKACDIFSKAEDIGSTRVVFFLTDGEATVGITNTDSIISNVKNANIDSGIDASIFVFGVGYDVNTHLLDKISNENHGSRVYVDPDESIETKLIDLYSKIQNPLLTDISIEVDGMDIFDTFPNSIPNLYEGSEIILVGKCKDLTGNAKVHIMGSKGDKSLEFIFNFGTNSNSKNNFIPRIWATRKIGALMDQVKLEGETELLKEEIKSLGVKYGIVTPYTSLLIKAQKEGVTLYMSDNMEDHDGDGKADGWQTKGKRSNSQSEINIFYSDSSTSQATTGANIQTKGNKIFADMHGTQMDLELLGNVTNVDLDNQSIDDWIIENLDIEKYITFGSEKYFDLLEDEELADTLSAGTDIVFQSGNEIYYVFHESSSASGEIQPIKDSNDNAGINKQTPGFEVISLIAGIGITLFILRKKQ